MNATKGGATLAVYIQTLTYRNFKSFNFTVYGHVALSTLKKQGLLLNRKRHRKKKNQKDTCVFFFRIFIDTLLPLLLQEDVRF